MYWPYIRRKPVYNCIDPSSSWNAPKAILKLHIAYGRSSTHLYGYRRRHQLPLCKALVYIDKVLADYYSKYASTFVHWRVLVDLWNVIRRSELVRLGKFWMSTATLQRTFKKFKYIFYVVHENKNNNNNNNIFNERANRRWNYNWPYSH